MRIRRRIISVIFAVVFIFSMAVVCSAATVIRTGYYDGCTYAISASCSTNNYSSVIEYQGSDTGDYNDYLLQTYVEYHYIIDTGTGRQHTYSRNYSIASTRASGYYGSMDNMEYLYASYYINTAFVTNEIVYP